MSAIMNEEKLKQLAKEFAKGLKTGEDLNHFKEEKVPEGLFFGHLVSPDRPPPGSLPQSNTVTLLNLLPEPVIAWRITIMACSFNEMYILIGNLISGQFSIRMAPVLGIFAQTQVFIVLRQPGLSTPGVSPVTLPAVFLRLADHAGHNGIHYLPCSPSKQP